MKKLSIVFIGILLYSSIFAQTNKDTDCKQIKSVIINFLHWYKKNEPKLETLPILTGFNEDYTKRADSIVKMNDYALNIYINNLKESDYLSLSFLNNIKGIYQSVGDTLKKYPLRDYFGPISGLEADLIFGFEPEEILDHIKEGRFTKIRIIYDKAMVKFDISKFNQYIFTLTKTNGVWLIDYLGFDLTNLDEYDKKSRLRK